MRVGGYIFIIAAFSSLAAWAVSAESGANAPPAQGASARPAATQPAPPAATQPSQAHGGFSLRGKVAFEKSPDSAKLDLSRTVIYLASSPALDVGGVAGPRPQVAQRDKKFVPDLLIVPRGTEVEFPNWDHFYHNVFSLSRSAPPFDLDRYEYGESKSKRFDNVGVVQYFCNVHAQMKGIIVVAPNRFFTRPDAQGNFELKDVPAGKFELVAWHERAMERRMAVVVGPEIAPELSIVLSDTRKSFFPFDTPDKRHEHLALVKQPHAAPK